MKRIVVLVLCLVSTLAIARGNSPITELQSLLAPISSMKANFKQTVYSESKVEVQAASGNMEYKKPNLFRWQVEQPDMTLLVTNGHKIWDYDEALEQVTVQKYTADRQVSPLSFIIDDASKLNINFIVTKLSDNCYKLAPKQENKNFVNVAVCFNSKYIASVRVLDHLGQTSIFEFKNMQNNLSLDNARFNFVPPVGVDVIGDE